MTGVAKAAGKVRIEGKDCALAERNVVEPLQRVN